MPETNQSVLALDVGGRRIGVAVAGLEARLPRPLTTLINDDNFSSELQKIVDEEGVGAIVVGRPRGLDGQETDQTRAIDDFVEQLKQNISLPVHRQDEAVTSKQAKAELEARGGVYNKGDIDALAATYILQDWLAEQSKEG